MKKNLKTVIASTILGIYLYSYLFFGENAALPSVFNNLTDMLLIIGISILIGYCIYYFNNYLVGLQYFKERALTQIITGIVLNYLFLLFICFILVQLYVYTFVSGSYIDYYNNHFGSVSRFYVLSFVFIIVFVLIDFTIRSYQKYSLAKVEAVQIAREQSELQLDAFKIQLSPHYLFNNLNTLTQIIHKTDGIAEKYIRNLSKTYDYILKNSKLDLVSLKEELEFIKAYSYLLNIRFGDSLSITINTDNSKHDGSLPPLSLQLLVENAVKHNIASPENKLMVEITQSNDYIEVKNNLLKKPEIEHATRFGLLNLRKRYAFFTNKEVFVSGYNYFSVKIPILKTKGNEK